MTGSREAPGGIRSKEQLDGIPLQSFVAGFERISGSRLVCKIFMKKKVCICEYMRRLQKFITSKLGASCAFNANLATLF